MRRQFLAGTKDCFRICDDTVANRCQIAAAITDLGI
jgi:hypothetical protein